MTAIELTGLRGDSPIGAMAAFGVLRIVTLSGKIGRPRLGWCEGNGAFSPVLYTDTSVDKEILLSLLIEDVRQAARREALTWTEQIKSAEASEFRKELKRVFERLTPDDRIGIDWLSCLANELVSEDDKLEPTPFDMSVARQKFPHDAVRLSIALGTGERNPKQRSVLQDYEEALFGPWRYQDDQHSFGWDPSTVKLGAFCYKAPTAMENKGVRAAVWLAFESLPLFPVFSRDRSQATRAFKKEVRRPLCFYWPIWRPPISQSELESLLSSAALTQSDQHSSLGARGVTAIYRSAKFKPNKYMVTFGAAELAYSTRA